MTQLAKTSSDKEQNAEIIDKRRLKMNEDSARKIQKHAFETSKNAHSEKCTAPYRQIIEQLRDKRDQIFEGAVFYLAKIAANSEQYREHIVKILTDLDNDPHTPSQRREYIEHKLSGLTKK